MLDTGLSKVIGRAAAHVWRTGRILSDEQYKNIRENVDQEDIARGLLELGDLEPHEIAFLQEHCKEPFQHDFNKSHQWNDDVLSKYADHIRNYYYKYKPEATDVDPSIDPNEQHIGPMAQDIEKVNPAVVKETPDGVKMVDTDRLALMNAGAIADLARAIKDIEGGDKGTPSDAGIKTDYTAAFKPQYKKRSLLSGIVGGRH